MDLKIVFGFRSRYGEGTTLTHAAFAESDTTLCGIPISPEWYDDEWADGPECKRCHAVIQKLTKPEFPVYCDAQGREHAEF